MTHKTIRLFAALLALIAAISLFASPALAADSGASLADGSTHVTIDQGTNMYILYRSTGVVIDASGWTYTSNDGISGPAYCVNWGLTPVSPTKRLEITGRYDRSPTTMGAFANGYPQRTLEQFKSLHPDIQGIESLTEAEYAYATQLAVWATCGQLAIPNTEFTTGRGTLVVPTSDAQQIRVYESMMAILTIASTWTKHLYASLYFHMEKDSLGTAIDVADEDGLEGAAAKNLHGIRKETIGGVEYFTRLMYVDSATSTYPYDYKIMVYSMDAPSGTIFTDENNTVLGTREQWGTTMYEVSTPKEVSTNLNENGKAYAGTFKLCIPVENAAESGSLSLRAYTVLTQYNLYLAHNPDETEQSYIIADPAYVGRFADASMTWATTKEPPVYASLRVQKVDSGAVPLESAVFTLTGSDGSSYTAASDTNGIIEWHDLPADVSYTLTETQAPPGYTVTAPQNITLIAGEMTTITVRNDTEKHFYIKKVDAQNGASLQGAVFRFEQIDGNYVTTAATGFDGMLEFKGEELPFGTYRVTEQQPPKGYEKDTSVQTINWDGSADVTLTFENVRQPSIVVTKVDGVTNFPLPGATFNIYKDGTLISTASTNSIGELRFPITSGEGYYEFEEIVAPDGYLLDRTRHGIYINPYDPATENDPTLVIKNYSNPSLRILKYDAQSGTPLSGVTFEIYKDSTLFSTLVTNRSGEILLYDLEPGTYLVKEIATSSDYVVNSSPQQIELKAGEQKTQTLVFLNRLKPGIRLIKLDSDTMMPIPNVRFEFAQVGGGYRQEFTTDENGEIELSHLEPGAYEVREIEAPEGYLLDDAVRVVQIDPGENVNLVFTNTALPSLVIVKFDPNTGKYLSGATFRIAKVEDRTHYLDRVSGTDGRIVLNGLDPGVYSITELHAPKGYIKNDMSYLVELFPGKTSQLVVNNAAKPNLKIVKTDAESGDSIEGVTFTIKKADGSTLLTDSTDKNGEILITSLDPGVYEVWERSAPSGYLLNDEHMLITLVPNKTGIVHFQNYPKPSLTVNKVDSITGDPLAGAKFHVTYASNDTFTGEMNDLGYYYSDVNGCFSIDDLHDGWYRIKEVEPPAGYAIREPAAQDIFIQAGEAKSITFENTPLSALVVFKYDSVTGKAIEGAVFQVRYLSGISGSGGTVIGTYTTSSNGSFSVTGLKAGTYVVEELASDSGHIIDTPPQTAYISGSDQDIVRLFFGNSPKGSLLVKKVDAITGAPLSDVEFHIADAYGTVIGDNMGKFITASDGTFLIEDIDPGTTLIAKETRAKDGYQADNTPQAATIKGGRTVTVEFRNKPLGSLLIYKKDAVTGEPLSGVEFLITDSSGSAVGSASGRYITDSTGTIRIDDLVSGTTVTAIETNSADGYLLDNTPQSIDIISGETVTLEFLNSRKGTLVIKKVDSSSPKPLQGAEFKITTVSGNPLQNEDGSSVFTTDVNGEIVLPSLAPGVYVITETKAPDGYLMDAAPQTVHVDTNSTRTITFTNTARGSLLITKIDSVTKTPLSGVSFEIAGCDGCNYAKSIHTTDSNGTILLTNLPNGHYSIIEVAAKYGYLLDDTVNTVKVEGGSRTELTVENTPLSGLLIKKMDAETEKPLSGVTFKVIRADGSVVGKSTGEYRTDNRGYILISNLEPGGYIVQEISAKDGYLLDDTPKHIEISDSGVYTLEFFNQPTGGLLIKKMDAETYEPLSDVIFTITTGDGTAVGASLLGRYRTNNRGYISVPDLEPGTYIVCESQAKEGYLLDDTTYTVTVKSGETSTLEFFNRRLGSLIIQKKDSVTGIPLQGVTFRITTASGEYVPNYGGKLSSNGLYYTDKNGMIILHDLDGTYVVTEERTIAGYLIDENTRSQTVVVSPNDVQTLTFYNTPLGSLQIIKSDADTNERIAGAVFEVRRMNGEIIGSYTTDNNGVVNIADAASGWYTVTELQAAEGYIADISPSNIEVKNGEAAILSVTNRRSGSVLIHKVDAATGKGIPNVSFMIYDSVGNPVEQISSDQTGYARTEKPLAAGKYRIREIEAPDGYLADTGEKTIYVIAGETTTIEWANTAVTGQIQIVKYASAANPLTGDPAGKALKGAVFEVSSHKSREVIGYYVSDARGIVATEPLPLGQYIIREVTPPAYYLISGDVFDIELEHAGQIMRLAAYNEPVNPHVTITKIGINEVLAGSEMYYRFAVANNGNTDLNNFHWHDSIPTDFARAAKLITGTYSHRINYRILYRTNMNDYRVLASDLLSTQNYSFELNNMQLNPGEVITDIYFDFGTVPAGFASDDTPMLSILVSANVANGCSIINKANIGGCYLEVWETASSSWITIVRNLTPPPKLPKTGY